MYYNVIIGFFDEAEPPPVSGSRIYLPTSSGEGFPGKWPFDADFKTFCKQEPYRFFTSDAGIKFQWRT